CTPCPYTTLFRSDGRERAIDDDQLGLFLLAREADPFDLPFPEQCTRTDRADRQDERLGHNDTDRQSETLGFFEPGLGVVGSPLSANVGTDHDGACAPCDFAFDLVVRSQSPSPSSSPISAVRSTGAAGWIVETACL